MFVRRFSSSGSRSASDISASNAYASRGSRRPSARAFANRPSMIGSNAASNAAPCSTVPRACRFHAPSASTYVRAERARLNPPVRRIPIRIRRGARVRKHSSRSSVIFVVAATSSNRRSADSDRPRPRARSPRPARPTARRSASRPQPPASARPASTSPPPAAPPPSTYHPTSPDAPPQNARPARFQSPAKSTRSASNVFAPDANRSIRSNTAHTSVTELNATSSATSPATDRANACSNTRIAANVTGVRTSSMTATRQP